MAAKANLAASFLLKIDNEHSDIFIAEINFLYTIVSFLTRHKKCTNRWPLTLFFAIFFCLE